MVAVAAVLFFEKKKEKKKGGGVPQLHPYKSLHPQDGKLFTSSIFYEGSYGGAYAFKLVSTCFLSLSIYI